MKSIPGKSILKGHAQRLGIMIRIRNKNNYNGKGHYVGRPTPLGNPFTHHNKKTQAQFKVDTVEEAIERYLPWLEEQLESDNETSRMFFMLEEEYRKEGVLTLICWCYPDPCHADVIAELIVSRNLLEDAD